MKKILSILMFFGFCVFLYSDSLNESNDLDENWISISESQGLGWMIGASVKSMKHHEDYIYFAGAFNVVKSTLANSIARLHLPTGVWSALGSELNGVVYSLSIVNNEKIYAAGCFKLEPEKKLKGGVFQWDGKKWEVISLEFDGYNFEDLYIDVDKKGNLYVAGKFKKIGDIEANNIAMWDGEKWGHVGSGLNGRVRRIFFDRNDVLFAVGDFYQPDGSGKSFAKWDGEKWVFNQIQPFSNLTDALIGRDGNLYGVGYFVESEKYYKAAKWDGNKWNPLGVGSSGEILGDYHALEVDNKGMVYLGGYFQKIGDIEVGNIAKWDGEKWHSLDKGVDRGPVESILSVGNDLYIGGYMFNKAGDVVANNIARWDGNKWNSIGSGIGDGQFMKEVNAIEIDSNGNILAGGNFRVGGCCYEEDDIYFAIFDGKKWSFPDSGLNKTVNAIVSDQSGNVYFGGNFTKAGGKEAKYVAKWDGKNWSALGSGTDGEVYALALDKKGNLYAGGKIKSAGDVEVYGVAMWNGEKWSALGSNYRGSIFSLYVNRKGDVFAGGCFYKENSYGINYVVKWSGGKWTQVGSALNDCVKVVTVDEKGGVYIGGSRLTSEETYLGSIAKLDGKKWKPLGAGIQGLVNAIKPDGRGNIYFGGDIEKENIKNIAKWDGKHWYALGSGVREGHDKVHSINIDNKGDLYVGGNFILAGNKHSNLIAKYVPPDKGDDSSYSKDESSSESGCSVLFF